MKRGLSLLLLGILLPACGGGGGGGGGGGTPPTPFTVVQRVPGSLATGVVRTANLYVRLNRAANVGTVNATNVNLELGAVAIPRVVTFDSQNLLVVINPDNPLDASANYRVTLGTGILDTNGVALTADTFTFSTSSNTDTTLPAFPTANFDLASATTTQLNLQWQAATDASAISYEVFVLPGTGVFDPTSTPNLTTANLTGSLPGLSSNTRFNLRLRARDAAGNLSANVHEFLGAKTLTSFAQDVYAAIINGAIPNRCTRCHAPGGMEIVPFTMETPGVAYNNLVNGQVFCAGIPDPKPNRVLTTGGTAARDNSFLYQKVSMSPPPCGERMPRDGLTVGYLSGTQIQTIGDWIIEGALDN